MKHPIKQIIGAEPSACFSRSGPPWGVVCCDAREGLKLLVDASVDCVVTSPPYFWQRDYGIEGQIGHEGSIQEYVRAIRGVFVEAKRILKSSGTLFLNLGDTFYSAKGKPKGQESKHRGRSFSRQKLRAVDGQGSVYLAKVLLEFLGGLL